MHGAPKKIELSDAPGFTIPVFSKKALAFLQPLLQDSVEILELLFDEGDYYGINEIAILDVVDYGNPNISSSKVVIELCYLQSMHLECVMN